MQPFKIIGLFSLSLIPYSGFATINGTNLIGVTPDTLGLAGAGSARLSSAGQALYQNPALLSALPSQQSYGLALSTVTSRYETAIDDTTINLFLNGGEAPGKASSDYRSPPVPTFYGAYRLNPSWVIGFGVLGYSGIGTDFGDRSTHLRVASEAGLARIPLSIAYAANDQWSLGASILGVAGQLAIQTADPTLGGPQSDRKTARGFGAGAQFGLQFQPSTDWSFAINAISPVRVTYEKVVDLEALSLATGFRGDGQREDLTLEQPGEWSIGVHHAVTSDWHLLFDVRQVAYGQAKGYRDFDWDDQTVWALGTSYTLATWTIQAGLNYGKAPISDRTYDAAFAETESVSARALPLYSIAATNALGLGVISEWSVGLGSRYQLSKQLALSGAVTYSPEASMVQEGRYIGQNPADGSFYPGRYRFETELSLWSATAGIQYDL